AASQRPISLARLSGLQSGVLHLRSRPGIPASAGGPGPVREPTTNVCWVHGPARGAGGSAGISRRVGAILSACSVAGVPVVLSDDLSLLRPLSDVATSGAGLALDPMAALCAVHVLRARLGADFHEARHH